ncbi:MAG TPA: HAD family hydrolase [Miltoncostaeaceae bacterium]|nr:HAD family hydrolase [Miltoncostaeaceae bacterium]
MSGPGRSPRAALVDIDGTLVDSNYQHALAWFRALRRHGVTCEVRVLHHLIGMGGDQIVTTVAGEEVERRDGDAIREAEAALFREMIDEVVALPDSRRLLEALAERARAVVLSSSAKPDEAEHYIDLLDARHLVDGWTTSEDVDATKPEPDLIQAALDTAGGGPALMIGDSTWDCRAAARAGVPTVTILTGGYCRQELLDAGAVAVFDTVADAIDGIAGDDLLA